MSTMFWGIQKVGDYYHKRITLLERLSVQDSHHQVEHTAIWRVRLCWPQTVALETWKYGKRRVHLLKKKVLCCLLPVDCAQGQQVNENYSCQLLCSWARSPFFFAFFKTVLEEVMIMPLPSAWEPECLRGVPWAHTTEGLPHFTLHSTMFIQYTEWQMNST